MANVETTPAGDTAFPDPRLPPLPDDLDALERALGGEGDQGHGGVTDEPPRLGIVAYRLADQKAAGSRDQSAAAVVMRRADEPFTAASTIKVYVLQALLEAVAAGELDLGQPLLLGADDQVTGSGVLKVLRPGTSHLLIDVATLMIVVSDNTATNLLIELLGVERIRDVTANHGWHGTHVRGKLQLAPVSGDGKSTPSRTTPRDLADHFARLWRGELLPPELTEVAKRIYRAQQFTELGRALDYDQYSAEIGISDMIVASKSGSVRGVRNDAGVITLGAQSDTPTDYVVAVMTAGCVDRRFHPENLGARVVGKATQVVLRSLGAW